MNLDEIVIHVNTGYARASNDPAQKRLKAHGMSVVRDNASTLYQQIAGRLRDEIAGGLFEPSGRLPSEAVLGRRFAVSRVTVRLALGELAADGLIAQRKGKGTFVAGRQVRHELDTLRSFHESLRLQGFDAGMRILRLERRTSPPEIAAAFGPAWKTCTFLERLHYIGQEPIAIGRSYLPPGLADLSIEESESRLTRSSPIIQVWFLIARKLR